MLNRILIGANTTRGRLACSYGLFLLSTHKYIYMYVRACLGLVGLVNGDLDQFLKCDHTYDVTHICVYIVIM